MALRKSESSEKEVCGVKEGTSTDFDSDREVGTRFATYSRKRVYKVFS